MTIRLRPFEPQEILAIIEGVAQGEARMGLFLSEGLRDFFVSGEVSAAWLERLRSGTAADPWQHGFAVLDPEYGTVIGTAGFTGPPDADGVVEIAYAIVPGREGRGYATQAATALVEFALRDPRVRLLRAHTLPEPNASTRVLAKCGFANVGEIVHPEDGPVWRWERARS